MLPIQEWIHKLEEGEGTHWIKAIASILAVIALAAFYDSRNFRNFTAPDAMDAAQLARNLAQGKGFTTDCVRPLSLHLVQTNRLDGKSLLKEGHPDLSNPPVYPLLLAAFMKVAPFNYAVDENNQFFRHQPDFLIGLFNQGWFFLAAALIFLLARKLFDSPVAWLATAVFLGTELYWRFSLSGLSSMFLLVLLLGLVWCLVLLEQAVREELRSFPWQLGVAGAAGLLLGLGILTRYSYAVMAIPAVIYCLLYLGKRSNAVITTLLAAAILVVSPWLIRNFRISGTFFGTAGYAIVQDTPDFPGSVLERSLNPDGGKLKRFDFESGLRKLAVNGKQVLLNDLPKLGGNWLSALFLAALLIPFKSLAISRLRIFICLSILGLSIAQALSRTYLPLSDPEIHSENLLMLCAPLVFIFGAGMFFLLAEQIEIPFPPFRRLLTVSAWFLACIPLWLSFLPPKSMPLSYPPYYPWLVKKIGNYFKPNELIMSDIPWAVAWYGERQSVWLTPTVTPDFFNLNDYHKTISAIYLSEITLDSRLLSNLFPPKGVDQDWGRVVLEIRFNNRFPKNFPLSFVWADILWDQFLIADVERWKTPPVRDEEK